eukprot:snap_masked-scaffold89_size390429-processed-gene-2.6 protein:Tk12451 transcript:snap_masked-scaffold89_size390429-processed-gene-2.6-mRNA-1 annotation:"heparan sulfate 2-o-sulfotransferase pipe"
MTLIKRKRVCIPKGEGDDTLPKECAVCGITSETFHLNYGASTCFSCRAFFRRAIERSRNPKFVCKKGGTCEVNPTTRKSCRKCRFNKCLEAGMKTDFVLDDSQKKIRFRRLLKKLEDQGIDSKDMVVKKASKCSLNKVRLKYLKKRSKSGGGPEDKSDLSIKEEPDSGSDHESGISSLERVLSATQSSSLASVEATRSPRISFPIGSLLKQEPSVERLPGPSSSVNDILGEIVKLDEIDLASARLLTFSPRVNGTRGQSFEQFQEIWNKTMLSNPMQHTFVQSILKFHSSLPIDCLREIPDFNKIHLHNYIDFLKNRFAEFSELNTKFNLLSRHDRGILINRNSCLCAALALGHYFGVLESGNQQVKWFFLGQYADTIDANKPEVLSFLFVCYSLQLTQNDDHLSDAFDQMRLLEAFKLQFEWIGPLCHLLLFCTDAQTLNLLDNPGLVLQLHEEGKAIFEETGLSPLRIQQLLTTLNAVDDVFVSQIFWGDIFSNTSTSKELHLPFSNLEDLWIQLDCSKIDSIIREISFGEEFMMECVMFNLDVPLSKTFFQTISRLWGHRFLCIMKSCSEFLQLSTEQQTALGNISAIPAFGLIQTKIEHLNTGDDQIKFGCGNNDISFFIEKYKNQIGYGKWRAMKIKDMNKRESLFDEACEKDLIDVVYRLKPLVMDPTIFKVLLLYVLFSSADTMFPPGHTVRNALWEMIRTIPRRIAAQMAKVVNKDLKMLPYRLQRRLLSPMQKVKRLKRYSFLLQELKSVTDKKGTQVALNDLARSNTGLRRLVHIRIEDLLLRADIPSFNSMSIRATAMEDQGKQIWHQWLDAPTCNYKSFVQRHFPDGVRKTAFLAHIRYFSHPNFHPIWISLVRDPVERFISRFYYIRRQAERFKAKAREIGRKNAERWLNMTIDECIASAQDECSIQAGRAYEPSPITYFCGFDSPCPLHNSRVALAKAKEHLSRNFSLVGILEEFQPFLARLESKFPQFFRGITQLKSEERMNKSGGHNLKREEAFLKNLKAKLAQITPPISMRRLSKESNVAMGTIHSAI